MQQRAWTTGFCSLQKQSQGADVEISPPICLKFYYLGSSCILLLGTIFQLDSSLFENIFETDTIYKAICF